MLKRSAEEKLAHYQLKIRKVEEEVKKKRLIRRPLGSSDDEIIEETSYAESHVEMMDGPLQLPEDIPESQTDEFHLRQAWPITASPLTTSSPTPHAASNPIPEQAAKPEDHQVATTPIETLPETPLDPELLSALGAFTSDTPDFGERIHESLDNFWLPLLRKGLSKEERDNLTKDYLIPVNCKVLQAPKVNAKISAAVSDVVRGRDKKLIGFQQELGEGITAINRAMDTLLKTDNKVQALKNLSDGCRLLTNVHYSFTKDRKKLIVPSLDKNILHVLQDTERDDTLFGNTLGEKIKACKAIERQSQHIRKTNPKNATPQTSASRHIQQGNWTGPPRYPSNRGGRGGQRRPAVPQARRPYTTTTSQTQPKGSSQSKTRANVH